MTPEERADILNDIEWMLEKKGYGYVVCGYDDMEEEAGMFIVVLQEGGRGNV